MSDPREFGSSTEADTADLIDQVIDEVTTLDTVETPVPGIDDAREESLVDEDYPTQAEIDEEAGA